MNALIRKHCASYIQVPSLVKAQNAGEYCFLCAVGIVDDAKTLLGPTTRIPLGIVRVVAKRCPSERVRNQTHHDIEEQLTCRFPNIEKCHANKEQYL